MRAETVLDAWKSLIPLAPILNGRRRRQLRRFELWILRWLLDGRAKLVYPRRAGP